MGLGIGYRSREKFRFNIFVPARGSAPPIYVEGDTGDDTKRARPQGPMDYGSDVRHGNDVMGTSSPINA